MMTTPSFFQTLFSTAHEVSAAVPERSREKVFLHLVSEIGELAEEANIHAGELAKDPGEDGIVGEACDVINCLADLLWLRCEGLAIEDRQKALNAIESYACVESLEGLRHQNFAQAKRNFAFSCANLIGIHRLVYGDTNTPLSDHEVHSSANLIENVLILAGAADETITTDQIVGIYTAKCAKWRTKAMAS